MRLKTTLLILMILPLLLAPLLLAQDAGFAPVDLGDYTGLIQSVTLSGYPLLGSVDAPVRLIEYCSFAALPCATFRQNDFNTLLGRVASGEAVYVFVPLSVAEPSPSRTASRSALCAMEQGKFWELNMALTASLVETQSPDATLAAANILASVDSLGLDRAEWDACMLSDRPDQILAQAQLDRNAEENFTGAQLPFVKVNGVPSLPDAISILDAINRELQPPTETPAPPDAPIGPEATEEEPPIVVTLPPLVGEEIEPPITMAVPPDWQHGYDALVLDDVDVIARGIPFAIYTGPVTGGQGTIVLLWGFPNLVAGNPFAGEEVQVDLWADGLRLLRLAIFEQGCNIGTDLRRDYLIGGYNAVGTQFAAVDCPELSDTRGWFAGVRNGGLNFIFYAYAEPIGAMDAAEGELQAILDSVEFTVP